MYLPFEMEQIIRCSFARMDSIAKTYNNTPGIESLTTDQIAEFNKLNATLNKCCEDLQVILKFYSKY